MIEQPQWPVAFMCPQCCMVSYGQRDVEDGYCGFCHRRTGRPRLPDWTCDGCVKRVVVIYARTISWRGESFLVVSYFCAECGRLLLRWWPAP